MVMAVIARTHAQRYMKFLVHALTGTIKER